MTSFATIKNTIDTINVHDGNRKEAAKALGIHQRTLERHVSEWKRLKGDYPGAADTLTRELDAHGATIDDVSEFWLKSDNASIRFKRDGGPSYEEIRDEMIEAMKEHVPQRIEFKTPEFAQERQHLLVIDPADVHIGKLVAESVTNGKYNIEIAVERMESAVQALATKAYVFGLYKIVLVIGNDILHVDNNVGTTTKGTNQNTDGKFWQMFRAARESYVRIIEYLTHFANVMIVFNPSNHDYVSGFMLADSLYSWFHQHPNVEFSDELRNIDIRDRKYIEYGDNLIGFTHGDGAKESELMNLMQYEAREAWGRTKYAYMYTHHLHHKIKNTYGIGGKTRHEKDYPGITTIHTGLARETNNTFIVETIRSPSPSDEWHAKNGFMCHQAIEAFLHHPTRGQIARLTEYF